MTGSLTGIIRDLGLHERARVRAIYIDDGQRHPPRPVTRCDARGMTLIPRDTPTLRERGSLHDQAALTLLGGTTPPWDTPIACRVALRIHGQPDAETHAALRDVPQAVYDLHDSDLLGPLYATWLTTARDDGTWATRLTVRPYRYVAGHPLAGRTARLSSTAPMHPIGDAALSQDTRSIDAYAVRQGWAHRKGRILAAGPEAI